MSSKLLTQQDEKEFSKYLINIKNIIEHLAQIELTLDATQRDSRYSQNLIDALNKEELNPDNKEISDKVDRLLDSEIRKFHSDCVNQNLKKWDQLRVKLSNNNVKNKSNNSDDAFHDGPPKASAAIKHGEHFVSCDKQSIEMEELRLDAYYNTNWGELETFNIEEAFNSQREKVEIEWGKHEQILLQNYLLKRKSLVGEHNAHDGRVSSLSNSGSLSPNSRWQHPEKQKSLIQTAPVLSPKSNSSASVSGSGAKAASNLTRESSSFSPELDLLERNHKKMILSSQDQKNKALKWIHRQGIRLKAHVSEVKRERQAIGVILSEKYKYLKFLRVDQDTLPRAPLILVKKDK